MVFPGLNEIKSFTQDYKMIPVWQCIPEADLYPIDIFKKLKNISCHCFILESLDDPENISKYTFLGYDPKLEISCKDGELRIRNGTEIKIKTGDPAGYFRQIIMDNKSPRFAELPPFTGGLAGYFSYEYLQYDEPQIHFNAPDEENFKDVDLMLFDKVIAFDHLERTIYLIVNIKTDAYIENYNKAAADLEQMRKIIETGAPAEIQPLSFVECTPLFKPLFSKEQFCEIVEKAKRYIFEGDIFQVVLSNRFEAKASGSLFDAYRILRETNPSPYMFYFSSDELEIAGSAPETLVKLYRGEVFTFPLAGTRKRGSTVEEDKALEAELLADPKELAEHNMLVDLGRNDIGKICEFGTVNLQKYLSVLKFSHVMHIGSVVTGQIRKDKTAIDAIAAVLPAGTLSGAPKIRACEIINELENNKRGIYGGAIGYMSFTGDMDTCIAIRIVFKKNGKVFVRSGAGIVADSVPELEYEETVNKAGAVLSALERAREVNNT